MKPFEQRLWLIIFLAAITTLGGFGISRAGCPDVIRVEVPAATCDLTGVIEAINALELTCTSTCQHESDDETCDPTIEVVPIPPAPTGLKIHPEPDPKFEHIALLGGGNRTADLGYQLLTPRERRFRGVLFTVSYDHDPFEQTVNVWQGDGYFHHITPVVVSDDRRWFGTVMAAWRIK